MPFDGEAFAMTTSIIEVQYFRRLSFDSMILVAQKFGEGKKVYLHPHWELDVPGDVSFFNLETKCPTRAFCTFFGVFFSD